MGDQDSGIRPLASNLYDASGCRLLILKLGERGVLACCDSNHESLDSFFVIDSFVDRLVDAVGAGDALLAYATLAMLAPFCWRIGKDAFLQASRKDLQLLRVLIAAVESTLFFITVGYLPLTDTMMLSSDPAVVPAAAIHPRVEPEIALRLADTVPAGSSVDEVVARCSGAFAAVEVVDSIWTGYRFTLEDSVYVAPEQSGAGVGRLLLGRLIDECTGLGYRQIVLQTRAALSAVAVETKNGTILVNCLSLRNSAKEADIVYWYDVNGMPTEGWSTQRPSVSNARGPRNTSMNSALERGRSNHPAPGRAMVSREAAAGGRKSLLASPCDSVKLLKPNDCA